MIDKSKSWTVAEMCRKLRNLLAPIYGVGEATAMTNLIFHSLKGWSLTDLTIKSDTVLSEYMIQKIDDIVKRLLKNEPIQYVLGESRFYGMSLKVTPDVLIPRQETEELVDLIVEENSNPDLKVLDIGTGSGAIAIALSRNLKFPQITALDVSENALKVARENADVLHARIQWLCQDIFTYDPDADTFDIIVSNPPYITESEKQFMESNVLDFEPHTALFVPDDNPLIYYSRIAETASVALKDNGRLYLEINPMFSDQLREMLLSAKFRDVRILNDISHRNRFAIARK